MVADKKTAETKYVKTRPIDVKIQTERAYQSQKGIFEHRIRTGKNQLNAQGRPRFWKSVGLGFRVPKEAKRGTYVDKKCPFTSDVSIRGRIITGIVHTAKMNRTIIIRRNYLHFVKKYQRYAKRHRNFSVHCSPAFTPKPGDRVIVGQCRPLSKTVRYNVLQSVSHKKQHTSQGKKFVKH